MKRVCDYCPAPALLALQAPTYDRIWLCRRHAERAASTPGLELEAWIRLRAALDAQASA